MNQNDIFEPLKAMMPTAEIEISGVDCSFSLTIVCDDFTGQTQLQRQKRLLSCFQDALQSGKLHALTVKAYTWAEWSAKDQHLVQLSG